LNDIDVQTVSVYDSLVTGVRIISGCIRIRSSVSTT